MSDISKEIQFTIDQLGLRIKQKAPAESASGNLPETIQSWQPTMDRMVRTAIERTAGILSDNNYANMRKWLMSRVVCMPDGSTPCLRSVEFSASRSPYTDKFSVIATLDDVSGYGTVHATPMILHGIDYLVLDPETELAVSNGKFACVLLRPKKGQLFRLIPLGLADEADIDIWNRIAEALPAKKFMRIDYIPLEQITKAPFDFVPQTLEEQERTERVSVGRGKDLKLEERPFIAVIIGDYFGKTVRLGKLSKVPVATVPVEVEGEACVTFDIERPYRFRATESENEIVVHLIGFADQEPIDNDVLPTNLKIDVNPFEVLHTTRLKAHPTLTAKRSLGYVNRPFNDKNPLFVGAKKYGLIAEGFSDDQIRSAMRFLHNQAKELLIVHMRDALCLVQDWLIKSPNRPTIEQALDRKLLCDVYEELNEPEDAVAKWIAFNMEGGTFHEESPMHLELRRWVLSLIAERAGYEDPKTVEAKPEEDCEDFATSSAEVVEVVEANGSVPAETEQPDVPAKPEKRKRSGGRKKKETGAASATT